jgi:hypothetical protein
VQLRRRGLPPISEVGAPELRLAGLRINPRTNGGTRDVSYTGLAFQSVDGGSARPVTLAGLDGEPRIGAPLWAPGGRRVAFTVTGPSGITLWAAEAPAPAPRRRWPRGGWRPSAQRRRRRTVRVGRRRTPGVPHRPGRTRRAAGGGGGAHRADRAGERGEGVAEPDVPGPAQEPGGRGLFDHYAKAQLALVGLDGRVTPLGAPAVRTRVAPSPDGRWLLVETVRRPYSYLVPLGAFASRTEVWTLDGRVARVVDESPLDEQVSRRFDQVPAGPRSLGWRADAPATLAWVEALDGGDPAAKVAKRDAVRSLAAPFAGAPVTHVELEYRGQGVVWARPDLAFVTEGWRRTRRTRTWAVDPSRPGAPPRLVFDRSSEDRYGDPGRFELAPNASGRNVLLTSATGRHAFLTGAGASAEGDRPVRRPLRARHGADHAPLPLGARRTTRSRWRCSTPTAPSPSRAARARPRCPTTGGGRSSRARRRASSPRSATRRRSSPASRRSS